MSIADSAVSDLHARPTANWLETLVEDEIVVERDSKIFKMIWDDDKQLCIKFGEHHVNIVDMITEIGGI